MTNDKNKEIRSFTGAAAPTIQGRAITGYAIVFNSLSEVMMDWESRRRFREIISPKAVSNELIQKSDIKMLLEHDKNRLLARSKQGKGSLKWNIDHRGVLYSFDAPKTADGDFAVEMLRRGDISGSSFAFYVAEDGDTWRKDGEIWVRTINKIRMLTDFSIVSDPAYSETSASVRSRINGTPQKDNGYKKRLHALAKKAGIAFTPAEKIAEIKKKYNL